MIGFIYCLTKRFYVRVLVRENHKPHSIAINVDSIPCGSVWKPQISVSIDNYWYILLALMETVIGFPAFTFNQVKTRLYISQRHFQFLFIISHYIQISSFPIHSDYLHSYGKWTRIQIDFNLREYLLLFAIMTLIIFC